MMKFRGSKIVKLFTVAAIVLCAAASDAKESLDWNYKAMTAGRAKLNGNGYVNVENMGTPNFSPEFAMSLQLVYDSSATGLGLFGSVWRCRSWKAACWHKGRRGMDFSLGRKNSLL